LEFSFNGVICRKIEKNVHVEAECEWDGQRAVRWIRGVDDVSTKEARVVFILAEAEFL
jgi:hypothetical protein